MPYLTQQGLKFSTIMQEYPLLNEDDLADMSAFTSLEEALESPDECFILELPDGAESEKALKEAFPKLPRIQQLIFLNNDQVLNFPSEIATLKNLQYLEIRDSILETLPEDIVALQHMTDLVITGCKYLTGLPAAIWDWDGLIYLEITDTALEELPAGISKMKQLEDLNINQNKLSTLPEEIGDLPSLKILRIYGNYAMTLPDSLERLQQLETFDHGLIRFQRQNVSEVQASMPNTTFKQVTSYDDFKDDDEEDFI